MPDLHGRPVPDACQQALNGARGLLKSVERQCEAIRKRTSEGEALRDLTEEVVVLTGAVRLVVQAVEAHLTERPSR